MNAFEHEFRDYLFKFQYGATNILTTATNAFAEEAFKFQYGATNMSQLLLLLLPLTFI